MFKFTCFVLCVVVASFSNVAEAQEKRTLRDILRPVIVACSAEYGVTDADIQKAAEAGSAAGIKPCFLGCVYNKAGFINSKGEMDLTTGLNNLRQFIKDDEQYNKYADVANKCSTVKDKAVSDGEAGCERGALLAACFLEHRANILI